MKYEIKCASSLDNENLMIILTRNLLTFRDSVACWANYTYCLIVIVMLPVFRVEECGECVNAQFILVAVVVRLYFKRVTLDPEVYKSFRLNIRIGEWQNMGLGLHAYQRKKKKGQSKFCDCVFLKQILHCGLFGQILLCLLLFQWKGEYLFLALCLYNWVDICNKYRI